MANTDTLDGQAAPGANTPAPAGNPSGGEKDGFWYVTIPDGKDHGVTDDGVGGEHPYEQPLDPNSLDANGKPKKDQPKYKVKDGEETGYNPAAAWVQPNGGKAEVIITPGRVVLVNIRSQRIAHKLQEGQLVRCDKNGKILS